MNNFLKKIKPDSLSISEVMDSKRRCFLNVWKVLFHKVFRRQLVNGYQTLLKSPRRYFYLIFSSFRDNLNHKKSLLVRTETLGLFVNTLIADDIDLLHKRKNFPQSLQMYFSLKLSISSKFLTAYLKPT